MDRTECMWIMQDASISLYISYPLKKQYSEVWHSCVFPCSFCRARGRFIVHMNGVTCVWVISVNGTECIWMVKSAYAWCRRHAVDAECERMPTS